MPGNPAWQPPVRGGWQKSLMVAIASLLGVCAGPAISPSQEPQRVAARLGPTAEPASQGRSPLEWQRREPTPAVRPAEGRPNTPTPARRDGNAAAGAPQRFREPTPASRLATQQTAAQQQAARSTPSRPLRWQGTLIRNPDEEPGALPYMIVDRQGLRQRYVRTGPEADLDRFLDREVTVLNDTGLLLDLEQIELRAERPATRPARSIAQFNYMDEHVAHATYEESPPLFRPPPSRPPAPTASNANEAPQQRSQTQAPAGAEGPDVRVAQRFEDLPLSTATGQPIVPGENIMIAPYPVQPSPGSGICPTCGRSHGGAGGCTCGARGRWYGRAEYLRWWTNGFNVPPLVTTSPFGTPQAQAGVLGGPNTFIAFGNGDIVDGPFDGGRFRAGHWLGSSDKLGIEGDYLGLNQESVRFQSFGNNGIPILARPFFNALDGAEDASLIAYPGLIEGMVTVDAASDLEMAGMRLRIAACCNEVPFFGTTISRVDFLAGYRYAQLDEQLTIREDSTSLDPENPGNFVVQDTFFTHNEFHGAEAGVVWEWERPRWSIELVGRIAVGNNQQDVFINGNTVVSDNMFSLSQTGGLLVQRTNIGHFERNRLSVIPELSATVAYKVTPRLSLTAGYTFLYWSNVVRPGDPIDLDVNPNLLPPEVDPFTGPLRPQFAWRESNFWAHGFSAGFDYRF